MVAVARPLAACLALFVSATFAVPAASAQDDPATFLTATNNTLWLHMKNSPRAYWLNELMTDPGHDCDVCGYNALGFGNADRTALWTIKVTPALGGPVTLDPAGIIKVTLWIGSWSTPSAGQVTVTTTLAFGGQTLLTGAGKAVSWQQDQRTMLTWEAPTPVTTLDPAAGEIVWTIRAQGAGSFIGISGGGQQRSNIVFPVVDGAGGGASEGPILEGVLEGAAVNGSLVAPNATSATHLYNWTSPGGDFSANLNAAFANAPVGANGTNGTNASSPSNGSVQFRVLNETGSALVNETLTSTENRTAQIVAAPAGNWSIEVSFANFTGTFDFALGPPPAAAIANTTSSTNSTTGKGDGGKSSPPAGAAVSLAVIAVAAVMARRGRRRD